MKLITKINTKSAPIGVIGLGYVGLPLVIAFCKAGFPVTGFDVDQEKVDLLLQGKSYLEHIDVSCFVRDQASFAPTADFSQLAAMDCVVICVPTPLNKYRAPAMSYVFNTVDTIAQSLRTGKLILLE